MIFVLRLCAQNSAGLGFYVGLSYCYWVIL
jgi:hypothetical protein